MSRRHARILCPWASPFSILTVRVLENMAALTPAFHECQQEVSAILFVANRKKDPPSQDMGTVGEAVSVWSHPGDLALCHSRCLLDAT